LPGARLKRPVDTPEVRRDRSQDARVSRARAAGPVFGSASLLAVLAVAACGGGDSGEAGGELPACAAAGNPIQRPNGLPESFPLPEGTVLDRTRSESGATVVEGYVAGDLDGVREFMNDKLPDAGYELEGGETEEHDAETEFGGNGVEGRLKLRDISGCEGALTLELAVRPG
jgi:hypothetical protein